MLLTLQQFTGRYPKFSDRLLPPNAAVTANNTEMYSGEVRGLRSPMYVATFSSTTLQAFRLDPAGAFITDVAASKWVQFQDTSKTVAFFRGPVVNDTFDRYYWSGANTLFRFNTRARVELDIALPGFGTESAYKVGVPRPTAAPTITPPGYVTEIDAETRSYVYTFVNAYNEESAPSDPSSPIAGLASGGTWIVSGLQTTIPGAGFAPIGVTGVRIYRTVSGQTVDFRFVAQIAPAPGHNDTINSDAVALNEALSSTGYDPPPAALDGVVVLPNGVLAGFLGKDVYLSEPYRPHAWPSTYIQSVDTTVIALGVHQSGLVVVTSGNPYVLSGVSPLNMSMAKLDDVEPCQSRRSMVATDRGVFYASQNGLVLVSERDAKVVTGPLMTRNEWRDQFIPSAIFGVMTGDSYLGFSSDSLAFILGNDTANGTLVQVNALVSVSSTAKDPYTGEVYLIISGQLYWWNPTETSPLRYAWLSKVFQTPRPINFGAYRILYSDVSNPAQAYLPSTDYSAYNLARFNPANANTLPAQQPRWLCPINSEAINGVYKFTLTGNPMPTPVQNKNGINGSPLQPTSDFITTGPGVVFSVYADCSDGEGMVLRYQKQVIDEEQHRLPSGFKAMLWQFEIVSTNPVYSIAVAETGRELASG